jgi:hypothetical protein
MACAVCPMEEYLKGRIHVPHFWYVAFRCASSVEAQVLAHSANTALLVKGPSCL